MFKDVEQALEGLADQLPQMVRDSLREQVERIKAMSADMLTIEHSCRQATCLAALSSTGAACASSICDLAASAPRS